ncbi:MAG: hypothetical protein R6V13_07085 [Anaerolineae bacterium]
MKRRKRSPYRSFIDLRAMLSEGWKIEPPVYVRPRWSSRNDEENTYHFVLWQGNRVNLLSVRDCPEMQEFLARTELAVDRL